MIPDALVTLNDHGLVLRAAPLPFPVVDTSVDVLSIQGFVVGPGFLPPPEGQGREALGDAGDMALGVDLECLIAPVQSVPPHASLDIRGPDVG